MQEHLFVCRCSLSDILRSLLHICSRDGIPCYDE